MWSVVVLGTLVVLALGWAVLRIVTKDGLGHRPPPSSRYDWATGASVEIDRSARVRG